MAGNPPLRIRGARGVTNIVLGASAPCDRAADNSPLKVRGVRGVINGWRDPEGSHYRQAGGELCLKQRESRFL